MTTKMKRVLTEALQLTEEERGDLAAHLTDSLDATPDADWETAWSGEIQQRVEELRTGQAKTIPWSEARRLIMEDSDEQPTQP